MQSLNSDQLRRQLDENNAAMNTLTEDNQKIVELLAQRGLQAVDPAGDDISPLTADELKAGGWWCADTSEDALKAFTLLGLKDGGDEIWDGSYYGCFLYERGLNLLDLGYEHHTSALKQIHRIGNSFYWGAP